MMSRVRQVLGVLSFWVVPAMSLFLWEAAGEDAGLVDVARLDGTVQIRMAYASINNFTKKRLYPVNRCLLTPEAARALIKVQQAAITHGLSLMMLDCYRPHPVSGVMWRAGEAHNRRCRALGRGCMTGGCDPGREDCAWVPLNHYLSRLSSHSRGTAVDVTLARLGADGVTLEAVDMGTPFDDFGPMARTRAASGQELENRMTLKKLMTGGGFKNYFREWWHFDFGAKNGKPVLSVPLQKDYEK